MGCSFVVPRNRYTAAHECKGTERGAIEHEPSGSVVKHVGRGARAVIYEDDGSGDALQDMCGGDVWPVNI